MRLRAPTGVGTALIVAVVATLTGAPTPAMAGPTSSGALVALELESGEARWRVDLDGGRFFLGGSVGAGRVYTTEIPCYGDDYEAPRVVAFDTRTGKRRWRSDADMRLVSGPVDGTVLVTEISGGDVHALDARTGEERWALRSGTSQGVSGTPTLVMVAPVPSDPFDPAQTVSSEVRAFDRRTGDRRWTFTSTPEGGSAPMGISLLAADERALVLSQRVFAGVPGAPILSNDLIVVDARSGAERFRARYPGTVPSLSGETVIIGATLIHQDETGLVGRHVKSGDVRWRFDGEVTLIAGSTEDETVYLRQADAVVAIEAKTGRHRWAQAVPSPFLGGGGDGVLVIRPDATGGDDRPVIEALDADTGKRRWEVPSPQDMRYSAEVAGFEDGAVFVHSACDY